MLRCLFKWVSIFICRKTEAEPFALTTTGYLHMLRVLVYALWSSVFLRETRPTFGGAALPETLLSSLSPAIGGVNGHLRADPYGLHCAAVSPYNTCEAAGATKDDFVSLQHRR